MSDEQWNVHLIFQDAKSNKFWRARIDDETLYVNYGRIGAKGQTQVKELGSAAACEKELNKLEASKRKKGYVDAEAEAEADDGDAGEAVPDGPVHVDLALEVPRKVDLRLTHAAIPGTFQLLRNDFGSIQHDQRVNQLALIKL